MSVECVCMCVCVCASVPDSVFLIFFGRPYAAGLTTAPYEYSSVGASTDAPRLREVGGAKLSPPAWNPEGKLPVMSLSRATREQAMENLTCKVLQ